MISWTPFSTLSSYFLISSKLFSLLFQVIFPTLLSYFLYSSKFFLNQVIFSTLSSYFLNSSKFFLNQVIFSTHSSYFLNQVIFSTFKLFSQLFQVIFSTLSIYFLDSFKLFSRTPFSIITSYFLNYWKFFLNSLVSVFYNSICTSENTFFVMFALISSRLPCNVSLGHPCYNYFFHPECHTCVVLTNLQSISILSCCNFTQVVPGTSHLEK